MRTDGDNDKRDFAIKKARYFTSNSVSNFPLTTQVLATEHGTPEILEQRQRDLVAELSEAWGSDERTSC